MDCHEAQEWLLQSEDPRPERCGSPQLADHLQTCHACSALTRELLQLEQGWREIPLPAAVEPARLAFLDQLAHTQTAPSVRRPARPARAWTRRWALAASLLVAAGLGIWLLLSTPRASASSEVVDSLIEWNLDLAQASATERERIYANQAPALRRQVQKTALPREERELAEKLLENGSWLAENDDPMGEADRFNDVADQLLERMNKATLKGNSRELRRLARRYQRVAEVGLDATLEKAQASGALDFERKRKLERVILRDTRRKQALEALLERTPEASRKEIKKELKLNRKARGKDAGTH